MWMILMLVICLSSMSVKPKDDNTVIVNELLQNLKMSLGFGNQITNDIVIKIILGLAKNNKEKEELQSKINTVKQNKP